MPKKYIEERDGGLYVAGTRVSLDSIAYAFGRGESPEEICQSFPVLSLEEVYGAITYYLANQAEIDQYLSSRAEESERLRASAPPIPVSLREKLLQARKASTHR